MLQAILLQFSYVRCSQRPVHNSETVSLTMKWRHFSTNRSNSILSFVHIFFCEFFQQIIYIISRLFFLWLVDWFDFCECMSEKHSLKKNLFSSGAAVGLVFSVGFHFILAAKRLFAISSYISIVYIVYCYFSILLLKNYVVRLFSSSSFFPLFAYGLCLFV